MANARQFMAARTAAWAKSGYLGDPYIISEDGGWFLTDVYSTGSSSQNSFRIIADVEVVSFPSAAQSGVIGSSNVGILITDAGKWGWIRGNSARSTDIDCIVNKRLEIKNVPTGAGYLDDLYIGDDVYRVTSPNSGRESNRLAIGTVANDNAKKYAPAVVKIYGLKLYSSVGALLCDAIPTPQGFYNTVTDTLFVVRDGTFKYVG